jgi:hypothetical protein
VRVKLGCTGSDDILFNLYLMEHGLGAISRPHTRYLHAWVVVMDDELVL